MKEGIHIASIAGILLLALLVMLAGLYMLAHAKKENLNKFYSTSSLVAVVFAICVFVFGIAGGIMCAMCGKCHNGGKMKHRMMMMHHEGMRGHEMMMERNHGGCEMGDEGCEGECHSGGEMKARHHGMRHGDHNQMKKEIVIEIEKEDDKNADTRVKKDETVK